MIRRTLSTFVLMAAKPIVYLVVLAICLAATTVNAATWYVDPIAGSVAGNGSQANPWRTLEDLFDNDLIETMEPSVKPFDPTAPFIVKNAGAPIKAGDTIILLTGDHGEIDTSGYFNAAMITIEAAAGHTPVLRRWAMAGAKNWTLRGLTISPEPYGTLAGDHLVELENHGFRGPVSDVTIEDCQIYTGHDSPSWTAADWGNYAGRGISCAASNTVFRGNTIRNVSYGIHITADNCLAEYNTIEYISNDGVRVGADDITIQHNTIRRFVGVNAAAHRDCIQGVSADGTTIYNTILRGNYMDTTATWGPAAGDSQGIGFFAGPYTDMVVENNILLMNHSNGIVINRPTNLTVVNNTVVDPDNTSTAKIIVDSSPSNVTVRNNIAEKYVLDASVTADHNIDLSVTSPSSVFVNYTARDVRPKLGGPAIDTGSAVGAPAVDYAGTARPAGLGWDIGAYEYADVVDGDADGDGDVDLDDFVILKQSFGASPLIDTRADFDGDGDVDLDDFVILKQNFGAGS